MGRNADLGVKAHMKACKPRPVRWILLSLILILFLETWFSNYNYFRIRFGQEENRTRSFAFSALTYNAGDKFVELAVAPIDTVAKNIVIYYKEGYHGNVSISVNALADGMRNSKFQYNQKQDRYNASSLWFCKNFTRVNLNGTSVCRKLNIQLSGSGADAAAIDRIVINDDSFCFNIFRCLFMAVIAALVLCAVYWGKRELKHPRRILLVAALVSAFVLTFSLSQRWQDTFSSADTPGDDHSMMLAAFMQGSVFYLDTPDERLSQMHDPYDITERAEYGLDYYYFDASYYNGHLCSYFGTTPIFTVMLPYYLLTGQYLSTYTTNLLFLFAAIFLIAFLYARVVERYCENITAFHYYLGYITIIVGSGLFSLLRGEKYDICVTSGIVFIVLALLLSMKINRDSRPRGIWFLLLGLSCGLIVLSKPSFITYYLLIAMLINEYRKKDPKMHGEILRNALLFAVPLGFCAIFQMSFNYLRFGNVLEFGNRYQLGANIPLYNQFSIMKLLKGMTAYLFTPPALNINEFPFLFMQTSTTTIGWNVISLSDRVVGLAAIPALYVLPFRSLIEKQTSTHMPVETHHFPRYATAAVLVALLTLAISISAASINDEYLIDIRLVLIGISCIIMPRFFAASENPALPQRIWTVLCLATVFVMLPLSMSPNYTDFLIQNNVVNNMLKNLFEFWA